MRDCLHGWCIADHADNPDVHEGTPARIAGVEHPAFPAPQVRTQVSYRDGDRLPVLYLTAREVDLTPSAVADLVDVLQGQLRQMRQVEATPQAVAR